MKSRVFLAVLLVLVLAIGTTFVQAQDSKIIKIATQSPLSGGQSIIGTGLRNATELAIQQLGDEVRALGFEIQLVPFDDQASPDVGVANAQQIVADASILAVIGHYNSGVAIPASEVYAANDLVMVSPANTNPVVTERGLDTINRVCGRDDLQGPTGARFVASLDNVNSVYILHDTTAYGQSIAEFFRDEAELIGLSVLGFEGTEERANFDGIIQPILAFSPDIVYMGGMYDQFGIFAAQARAAGYTGLFMGPDGFDSADYAELAGEAAIGTYITTVAGPANLYPNAAQFIEDYIEAYGEFPTPFAAQSYDSTGIALKGIAAAIEEAGGEMPTRAAISAAVRQTENYEGLTNDNITFDAVGDPEIGLYYVIEVVSSDPDEWSNNEVISTLEIPSPYTSKMLAEAEEAGDADADAEETEEESSGS